MRLSMSLSRHLGALRLTLAILAAAALAAACGGGGGGGFGGPGPGIAGSSGTVKVAVLLPLTASGSTPAVAKALKQAAELALFDFDNPNVTLIPKDTKGSPEGARLAAESAFAGRRRADHRAALRPGGHGRGFRWRGKAACR